MGWLEPADHQPHCAIHIPPFRIPGSLGLNMYFLQEPAPPAKTKERYDEIEMAYVRPHPKDFTKVRGQSPCRRD